VKICDRFGKIFYNLAAKNIFEGQKIEFKGKNSGDISPLGELETGTKIFNIENSFEDGGKFVRTGGNSAIVLGKQGNLVKIMMPSKKEKMFDEKCRATIGELAGQGRLDKPILKAGKQYYIKKAKSKLWPRTSAVKMNAIDHPFGSGRGKRIKSKIIQRFASPGQKVGLLRPRRTGRKNK
jgi:large subunit ribosomal protein L2